MKNLFSIGEISKLQNISRQTLIFYDKIGLFCPAYTDSNNGYRYYSSSQIDYLDTICIMKKIGFSLDEIKAHIKNFTIENSIIALRKQLTIINRQIDELQMLKTRVEHRCLQLEHSVSIRDRSDIVSVEEVSPQYILLQKVAKPYTLEMLSIATKECFVRSFKEQLPIFFQSYKLSVFIQLKPVCLLSALYLNICTDLVDHLSGCLEMIHNNGFYHLSLKRAKTAVAHTFCGILDC